MTAGPLNGAPSAAIRSGCKFENYSRPAELLRACQAVLEAAILYHDNKLGTSQSASVSHPRSRMTAEEQEPTCRCSTSDRSVSRS